MKKKLLIPVVATISLLVGGVAGATSSTLSDYGEGLKGLYTAEAEEFKENFELYDMALYQDEKAGQFDEVAQAYFDEQKAAYVAKRKGEVDAEYNTAKASFFAHVDSLFE